MKILNAEVYTNENGESSWTINQNNIFAFFDKELANDVQKAFLSLAEGDFDEYQNWRVAILANDQYKGKDKALFIKLDDLIK
ncbi:MAG: hypothetical protein Q8P34_01585 [Bacteroidota bacterium]|nr:hypothetical protein [Bacteroidota bacterium]